MLNAKMHQEESGSAVEHGPIVCKALNSVLGTERAALGLLRLEQVIAS